MSFLNAFGALGRILIGVAIASAAVAVVVGGDSRMVFLVLVLTFGATGATFAFVGSRLGKVSGITKRLRAAGETGTATITSMDDTGVKVNGSPVLAFELEVDVASHAPYSTAIRQRVPLAAGPLGPGSLVPVLVDRADPHHLAIDWDAEVESAPTHEEVVAATAGGRDAGHLLRVGRPAKATIISMEDAGDMSELGLVEVGSAGDDDRLFIIGLEVRQAGLDTYDVRVAHRVPERLLGRVGPRTEVQVAVDRDDESAVAIDWSSVRR